MQTLTDKGVKTFLIYYVNSRNDQVSHVEALFTESIDDYVEKSSYKELPEDLAEHLIENNCDRRLIWEVKAAELVGGVDTSFAKVPGKDLINWGG